VAITDDGVSTFTDPTRKAIVRPDTGAILGVFRSGYKVQDYDRRLIENVETILDADLQSEDCRNPTSPGAPRMSESATVRFARPIMTAAGVYAPGHIGELTQYLPFELVDDVLSLTKTFQTPVARSAVPCRCTSCLHSCCSPALALRGYGRSSPQD
jgi:hypothetical protein